MVDTRQFAREGDKSLLGVQGALQANAVLQNRYRIEGVLGIGGMGSVYQARDMQFPDAKRYVAVKEMLHQSNDPQLREVALRNFKREANILAGLNHPSIPSIYDYFATKERAYLVMEFINGKDLDSILNMSDDFLPMLQVIEWCVALCDVLSYLHYSDPPIVFRDVKPSNIMIDVHGRLRLIDFGIAKHFDPDTKKGTMIGTEGYAAPESYRGLATPSSDLFGVGATMHHILTRHDPRMEAPFTFANRIIHEINPDVPPDLESIVMRSVAFGPEERFSTAEDMKNALENFLAGKKTPALISSGGGVSISDGSPMTESWEGIDTGGIGIEPVWKFKVEEEIRSTPVVSHGLVFVTAYDNNLYSVDANDGQLKWKYAADDVIAASPAVSEDDNLVIFGSKDCSLYAVDIRAGRIKWTFQTQGPIYSSPNVQHGHVFFGSDDGTLYALRVATGRQAWKQEVHIPIRTKPAVTGERIICGTRDGELLCIDLSGQAKWRFKARREIISSPLVVDNIVYVGSMDGHVYAIDVETSWTVWKVQTNKPVVSSPCYGEDKVFVGSANGCMYAFDAQNGRERWKFDTGNQITSSPIFTQGAIYFGANDHKIYSLEAKSGKERWSYHTGGVVPGSPCVMDGTVYIGSTDQYLYAFKA